MHRFSTGRAARFGAVTVVASLVGLGAIAAPATAAATKVGHAALAYGTSIQLSSVFSSDPTAVATLGCTASNFAFDNNSALSAGLLTAGSTGEINDTVSTSKGGTTAVSNVHSMSLFSSLITADAVTATAGTTTDGTTFATSGDTTVADLSINGTPMSAPGPNTVVPLGGLGTLTLNEQISQIGKDSASMTVNALHLHVDVTNTFGFPVGTDIVIGHARAQLESSVTQFLGGKAFATQVVGTGVNAGKSAIVHIPCDGTNGKVRTNTTVGTVIPGVINTGTEKSTATGTASKSFVNGTTTDTINNVTLLNLVSVDQVKAQANVTAIGKDRTFTDTGSSFGGISVLGIPTLPDPVPPNSMYPIPGVGTLYLHRVIQNGTHIEVRMIELVITVDTGTLPVGTDIQIGVATVHVNH